MNTDPRQHVPAFVRKQHVDPPATRRYQFRMRGRGAFPLAMLAHDQCYPATERDASEIHSSSIDVSGAEHVVTLEHVGPADWVPTQRWYSYGWTEGPVQPTELVDETATSKGGEKQAAASGQKGGANS